MIRDYLFTAEAVYLEEDSEPELDDAMSLASGGSKQSNMSKASRMSRSNTRFKRQGSRVSRNSKKEEEDDDNNDDLVSNSSKVSKASLASKF